ncbi:MAG: hypothetical protein M5R36_09350 [Deltaproteobacteria bacterium]|nr:hypothetical protein [Deltaproteobacteria bacterium]
MFNPKKSTREIAQPKAENATNVLDLRVVTEDFARALAKIDNSGAVHKQFRPGIGPFGEAAAVKASLEIMRAKRRDAYAKAKIKRQPDLLIPTQWQIEFKVVRPFGDNGKEAENWSQNLLHPYAGNTSLIGDCLKLVQSIRGEKKAIIAFGYEHSVPQISLDPCVQGFELLATKMLGIRIAPRIEWRIGGLIHPVHQVVRVFAWEVLGRDFDALISKN